jgi:hypothetical protein
VDFYFAKAMPAATRTTIPEQKLPFSKIVEFDQNKKNTPIDLHGEQPSPLPEELLGSGGAQLRAADRQSLGNGNVSQLLPNLCKEEQTLISLLLVVYNVLTSFGIIGHHCLLFTGNREGDKEVPTATELHLPIVTHCQEKRSVAKYSPGEAQIAPPQVAKSLVCFSSEEAFGRVFGELTPRHNQIKIQLSSKHIHLQNNNNSNNNHRHWLCPLPQFAASLDWTCNVLALLQLIRRDTHFSGNPEVETAGSQIQNQAEDRQPLTAKPLSSPQPLLTLVFGAREDPSSSLLSHHASKSISLFAGVTIR